MCVFLFLKKSKMRNIRIFFFNLQKVQNFNLQCLLHDDDSYYHANTPINFLFRRTQTLILLFDNTNKRFYQSFFLNKKRFYQLIVLNHFYFHIQTHFDRAIKCLNKYLKNSVFLQSKIDIVHNHLVVQLWQFVPYYFSLIIQKILGFQLT